jgi:hypothetical protein
VHIILHFSLKRFGVDILVLILKEAYASYTLIWNDENIKLYFSLYSCILPVIIEYEWHFFPCCNIRWMSLPLRQMKREFCGMHFCQLKRVSILVRCRKCIEHFAYVLWYLNFLLYTGLDIDDFVEISSQLIQPLEDFFNNVFVMVVC